MTGTKALLRMSEPPFEGIEIDEISLKGRAHAEFTNRLSGFTFQLANALQDIINAIRRAKEMIVHYKTHFVIHFSCISAFENALAHCILRFFIRKVTLWTQMRPKFENPRKIFKNRHQIFKILITTELVSKSERQRPSNLRERSIYIFLFF